MALDERVLVVTAEHFQRAGAFEGFRTADDTFTCNLLDPRHYRFVSRRDCETDPSLKQLIPYIVLTHGPSVFHYTRGVKGTEIRLAALRSVGIGGHISEADAAGGRDPYLTGLQRELDEEVELGAICRQTLLGFIYDPRTPVGSVHLGVVHHFELAAAEVHVRDAALTDAGFSPRDQLRLENATFETWSQFVLDMLPSPE